MSVRWLPFGAVLVGLALAAAAPVAAAPTLTPKSGDEALVYRWRLEGIKGLLLRLVAPAQGEGVLNTLRTEDGNFQTELHISAEQRRKGDFWLYGSEIDPTSERSVRAWTAQVVGKKSKSREADLEGADVIDMASGILLVRRDPPRERRRMRIWSNGKLYPVIIEPRGSRPGRFRGREARVSAYRIRGYRVPGEREWRGGVELYLADDESATPVEIFVLNKGVRVRLKLDEEASQLGLPPVLGPSSRSAAR